MLSGRLPLAEVKIISHKNKPPKKSAREWSSGRKK